MAEIHVLDHETVDQIAAGEVVERPLSVVKELVENSIDAGSTAISVEIKEGGISMIRVTDNGCGIESSEIRKAFLRHATSKIESASDLNHLHSLGFRGEALSSIAAVSQVELTTKTAEEMMGSHVMMEGPTETTFEEVGAPKGTTIIVRNLFFNTPVRKKFLKSPSTEGSYIAETMEHLALSHPDIAFQFSQNGNLKFSTAGNGNLKEIIYRIYGKEVSDQLIGFSRERDGISVYGFLGKPSCNRSNRNTEIYFLNRRYIRSNMIAKAIEEGYHLYLMQHKYPFVVLMLDIDPEKVDVNVHPTKMDVRFENPAVLYDFLSTSIASCLKVEEMIPPVILEQESRTVDGRRIEPFMQHSLEHLRKEEVEEQKPSPQLQTAAASMTSETKSFQMGMETLFDDDEEENVPVASADEESKTVVEKDKAEFVELKNTVHESAIYGNVPERNVVKQEIAKEKAVQLELFEPKVLSETAREKYQILGQIFETYWLIVYEDKLFMMDQHAAHEKVKFEKFMKAYKQGELVTQNIYPPVVVSLSGREQEVYRKYKDNFTNLGFETESFGGNEIKIFTAPTDLYGNSLRDLFLEVLDDLDNTGVSRAISIEHRIATMSCKAAVKGNNKMTFPEVEALLDEMLACENPYFCPHGRPTLISFSKAEIEKRFHRIV